MKLATAKLDQNNTVLFASLDGHRHICVNDIGVEPDYRWLVGVKDVQDLFARRDDASTMLAKALKNVAVDQMKTLDQLALEPPITDPRAVVCVGRNYPLHVAEGKAKLVLASIHLVISTQETS